MNSYPVFEHGCVDELPLATERVDVFMNSGPRVSHVDGLHHGKLFGIAH